MITAVLSDVLRAHESGGYQKKRLVWIPCSNGFSEKIIERLEMATKTALCMLFEAPCIVGGQDVSFQIQSYLDDIPNVCVGGDTLQAAAAAAQRVGEITWRSNTMRWLEFHISVWSTKAQHIYKDYCKWAFMPLPPMNAIMAFKDLVLWFLDGDVKQLKAEDVADCYNTVPESLAYRPSDEFIEWFRKYFTTTIAGDMDVMELEFSVETLATLGLRLPHHLIVYFGSGGNAKGARSRLRARAYGSAHKWVPPAVFDRSLKDEFRKVGTEFYGALFCTIREGDGFDVDEKALRAWTAGEGIGCRLPHAVHTPMLEWPCTGKAWEMNPKNTPRIPSINEKSMSRRIIGIEKDAQFTTKSENVDPAKKIFEADPDLEDKIESGDAVWCYNRLYFFPWRRKPENNAASARRRITSLTPSLQKQTDKLLQILAENQGLQHDYSTGSTDSAKQGDTSMNSSEFRLLKQCHDKWQEHRFVKDWMIEKATWINKARCPDGSKTRLHAFKSALESPANFFFDEVDENLFWRAPFCKLETVLCLNPAIFGEPASWLPFFGNSGWKQHIEYYEANEVLDFDCVQEEAEDGDPIVVNEIGHLPSLLEYQSFDIDREPALLESWILELQDGSPLGDGWMEVGVPHYQAHGIPGRLLARPKASLAKITKEARAVSVQGRCFEEDFPISHWMSLFRLLVDNRMIDDYALVQKFANNFESWRSLWGKQTFVVMGGGGTAQGKDAWNPATWTLAAQMRNALSRLLALPQYAYLNQLFRERKDPFFTRSYYLLCSDEVQRLLAAREQYDARDLQVRGLIYDSLLTEGYSKSLNDRLGLVQKPMQHWQDNFFMCLRKEARRTPDPVRKLDGKAMCLFSSALNVGTSKVQKAVSSIKGNGPHTYAALQQHLVAKKTGEYLHVRQAHDVTTADVDSRFLIHALGHCVGLVKKDDDRLRIFDCSYTTQAELTINEFVRVLQDFQREHKDFEYHVWVFARGAYQPSAMQDCFHLSAGGVHGWWVAEGFDIEPSFWPMDELGHAMTPTYISARNFAAWLLHGEFRRMRSQQVCALENALPDLIRGYLFEYAFAFGYGTSRWRLYAYMSGLLLQLGIRVGTDDFIFEVDIFNFVAQCSFKDICLAVALRNLGLQIAPDRDGPFSTLDAQVWLTHMGLMLWRVQSDALYEEIWWV